MITKHFLKTLVIFTVIIGLGLIGVFLVNSFGEKEKDLNKSSTSTTSGKLVPVKK